MSQQSNQNYGRSSSIYPYYKQNDVFARDEQYYSQLLTSTRNVQNLRSNSQSISQVPYQQVQTRYIQSPQQVGYKQQGIGYQAQVETPNSRSQFHVQDAGYMNQSFGTHTFPKQPSNYAPNPQPQSQQYIQQASQNKRLKQRLDDLINYRDASSTNQEITKKYHYNTNSQEGRLANETNNQMSNLMNTIKRKNSDIHKYRQAIQELQKIMNNIQSVDREIYKQLKTLSNRDQQLLDTATAALARGATRDQIASYLERIIS